MRLYERVRPKSLDDVVGQEKAVLAARRLLARGAGGSSVWLSGESGVGKTTLARIIAEAHTGGAGIVELDAADELGAAELDQLDNALTFRPLWGDLERRAWIVNEAHGLKPSAIRRLLGIMERIARDPAGRLVLIFTTTRAGEDDLFGNRIDAGALLSRCQTIPLTNQGLALAFATDARRTAQKFGLDGKPIEFYVKLAKECRNNYRLILNRIEEGAMSDEGGGK